MAHHGLTQSAGDVVHEGRNRRMVYGRRGGTVLMVGGVPPRNVYSIPNRRLGPPGGAPNLSAEYRRYRAFLEAERRINIRVHNLIRQMTQWIGQHFPFNEAQLEDVQNGFSDAEENFTDPANGTQWAILAGLAFPLWTEAGEGTPMRQYRDQILVNQWWQTHAGQLEFLGRDLNVARNATQQVWENYKKMWESGNGE